jgi:arylsulfatase A-like enzyme
MPGEPRSAVVVVVDRLGAGFLGPYGNAWLQTPQFNRFASEAQLFEWCLADSPRLERVYRSYWTGRHAMAPEPGQDGTAGSASLPEVARAAGLRPLLLTDDRDIADLTWSAGFDEKIVISPQSASTAAGELEETALGGLFLSAIETLSQTSEPVLLWVHSRGMAGPWDAPSELRRQFADEDDPPAPEFVEPPQLVVTPQHNPDDLLGVVHAYAGQVSLLDACLGALLDAVEEHSSIGQPLVAVTSPRGYPLGEHGWVGGRDALYGELLHVPLLVRFPLSEKEPARVTDIAQPADLYRMVRNWIEGRSETLTSIQTACAVAEGELSIRTPAWFLRETHGEGTPHYELYTKPDDRWEVNEIASRGGDVVELLVARLRQFQQAAEAGNFAALPELPGLLANLWR